MRRRALASALGSVAMLAGLAWGAAPVGAVATPAPAPTADAGETSVGLAAEVALHTVSPAAIAPGDTLVLAGSVTNTGSEPLQAVQALPRFSITPLDTRDQIDLVESDRTFRRGSRPREPFQELGDTLTPGESVDFSLEIPVDDLGFSAAGVYVVGVDIRVDDTSPDAENDRVTVTDTRTVVTYLPDDEPLPQVPVATVWDLETQPRITATGTFTDDSLAAELGDTGRLGHLLRAGSDAPVTWLVDPDLLLTVEAMSDEYAVGADASPGAGTNAANRWWDMFETARGSGATLLTPLADPDIESYVGDAPELAERLLTTAVAATGETAQRLADGTIPDPATDPEVTTPPDPEPTPTSTDGAAAAADAAPESDTPAVTGPVARVTGDAISQDAVDAYAAAGVDRLLMSPAAVTPGPAQPFAEISTDTEPVEAIVTDAGLNAALADAATIADSRAAATQLVQRWRAETAMIALQAQQDDTTPAPLVAAAPPAWDPAAATVDAAVDVWTTTPWIAARALGDLATPDALPEVELAGDPVSGALPEANVEATADLDATAHHFVAMLADPSGGDADPTEALDLTVLRSASRAWLADPPAGVAYTAAVTERLTSDIGQVTMSVPEQVTLSSRTGVFPLTVENPLDYPVSVRIAVNSANPDRLRVDAVTEQIVESGSRSTVNVSAEAFSNGRVPVDVGLVAVDGSPLGPQQRTIVTATDYGAFGWVVVGAGALMLVWSLGRRAWRRRHPNASSAEVLDEMEADLDAAREAADDDHTSTDRRGQDARNGTTSKDDSDGHGVSTRSGQGVVR